MAYRSGSWQSSLRLVRSLLLAVGAIGVGQLAVADDVPTPVDPSLLTPSALQAQREHYLAAKDALHRGKIKTFRQHAQLVTDYPLHPYLEYAELRRRLYLLPYEDVDQFLDRYQNTYIGDELNERWLNTLHRKKHWHDYQTYYTAYPNSARRTDQQCWFLLARLNSGDQSALQDVEPLWNVGKSQPDECDPLFKAWMDAGYLTDDIAWERFQKAMANREITLARYLVKHMPASLAPLGKLVLEVDRHPQRLKKHHRFDGTDPRLEAVILHGIRRYARRDPLAAMQEWEHYDAKHYFEEVARSETQQYLITRLVRQGEMQAAQQLLQQTKEITSQEVIEWLARDALRNQDWQRVYDSLQLMTPEEQQSERWLYWRARALEKLGIEDPDYPTPKQIYASLALTRGFYGFMAADVLGHEYTFIDRPVDTTAETLEAVARDPALVRAKELFELGELNDARHEWLYATEEMKPAQLLAAGKLAEQWGWYRKSIQAVVEARYWDDLQLRFPLAYEDAVNSAAAATNIDSHFLFAIARQESAFAADAKSSAGAMGLMQLMPATARQTARQIGVKYRYWDLIKPDSNITLGSNYLHQLLDDFGGNRILATAAYNAGPHRVKQWLSQRDAQIPYDIWIETIPFNETRGYVQNVLSYSVIYSYRLGSHQPLLSEKEISIPLIGLNP